MDVSILIVDDDDAVRRVVRRMLEGAGYEIREAANGKAAILEHRREPADLVIVDIFMPEQEGMETIAALRREHPGLRVIAISGIAGSQYLRMAKLMGVWSTLQKPLRLKDVVDTVRDALDPARERQDTAA